MTNRHYEKMLGTFSKEALLTKYNTACEAKRSMDDFDDIFKIHSMLEVFLHFSTLYICQV